MFMRGVSVAEYKILLDDAAGRTEVPCGDDLGHARETAANFVLAGEYRYVSLYRRPAQPDWTLVEFDGCYNQ